MNFTHLHVHTPDSLLDGFCKIDKLINKVKELNMTSIAITDHGTLAGTYDFQKTCKENNIKPILGMEIYYTKDMKMISLPIEERKKIAMDLAISNNIEIPKNAKKKEIDELIKPYMYNTKGYHLILLAKNQIGWNNLVKISSIANEYGLFNGKGHCDYNLLKQYSEGIICTTACMGSIICDNIKKDNIKEAEAELILLKDIYKDNLYLEIQPLNHKDQLKINLKLIQLASKYNIELVATNDSHYVNQDDWYTHDVLLCIGTGKKLTDENRMKYSKEFWIRSYDEMIQAFHKQFTEQIHNIIDKQFVTEIDKQIYIEIVKQSLLNTNIIAEKISEDILLGSDTDLFPNVDVPKGYTPETWLSHQCWTNLYKYLRNEGLKNKKDIYEERLKHELNVINIKGFASYFLVVQDAIEWGDNNDCPFGPGRGSAAGSLVSFLIGIVKGTDPIEYDLLFSRFLTMNRTSPPDIDSDIDKLNRQKFIKYLNNKYGHENVCQVGTKTILGVLNGIKDVMRVFDISFSESNKVSKQLSTLIDSPSLTFKMFDDLKEEDINKYNEFKKIEEQYKEIFYIARALEGTVRNYGVHAGGVLITPVPINDIFPTRVVDGKKVTVWDKDTVEKAKGIKFDMLGLKTISVINLTLKLIKKYKDIDISLQELYNNKSIRYDENVFDMLKQAKSDTVFQMESDLFKSELPKFDPDNIDDLIALTACMRPGPLAAGYNKMYADRKSGKEKIEYALGCNDILGNTYGCMLYQEQLMLIAKKVAGFSDNQTDTYLRKSVAKKKRELMNLCKEWFINGKPLVDKFGEPIIGGICNGFDKQSLEEFWEQTVEGCAAYLFNKSHATSYSLLSCITAWLKYYYPLEYFTAVLSLLEDEDKRDSYISILEKEYNIKVVVPDINLSEKYFSCIPEENKILYGLSSIKGVGDKPIEVIIKNRPYDTLENFYEKVTKTNVNKTAGKALIKTGAFDSLYKNTNRYELLNKFYDIRKDKDERYDINMYDKTACISLEKEIINVSLTYKEWIKTLYEGEIININCIIKSIHERYDKNNNLMAFITIEKEGSEIELTVFARDYIKNIDKFIVGNNTNIYCKVGKYKGKTKLTYIDNKK